MNIEEELRIESDTFYKVLEHYLPECKNSELEILNICCGTINEEAALFDYFGRNVRLKSIDNNPSLKEEIKRYARKTFEEKDVSDLEDRKFDVLMGRNIDYGLILKENQMIKNPFFDEFFSRCGDYLKPEGILFLTFPFEYNYQNGIRSLDKKLKLSKESGENKFPVRNNGIGSCIWTPEQSETWGRHFKDEYLLIAKNC